MEIANTETAIRHKVKGKHLFGEKDGDNFVAMVGTIM